MDLKNIGQWYYLIFLIPGAVSILLLLLSAFGSLGGDSDGDTDTDADADSDTEVESEADSDADGEESGGSQPGAELLHFIGAGKAPLTLVLGALLLGWSFAGFWADYFLESWLKSPAVFIAPAIVIALVGGVFLSRTTASVAAYFVPKIETAAVTRESLVGQEARVVFPISATAGRAFYYDKNAVLHDVTCRVRPGEPEIPKGRMVILAGYDNEHRRFWVEPSPFDDK